MSLPSMIRQILPPMHDPHEATTVLMPGEWCLRSGEGAIETLLGSCVALVIWDPATATAACCHFMLPGAAPGEGARADGEAEVWRFGRQVVPAMWRALRVRGIPPERCVHKLFGGGRMFPTIVGDIGADNIACARELLRGAGIVPTAESVGDEGHRRIRVDVATGAVFVQFHPLAGCAPTEAVA